MIKCDLRLNDEKKELHIATIEVETIPRVGEFIAIIKRDNTKRFKVAEVWHFVSNTHRVILYVNHTGR